MPFTYAPGSRPIEPYTIKHAIGSGGFGEVYYAVSDAGKEVALKCLRRECETELRGIRTCLNLLHPHLVTIYDLRQSGDGMWWLIMEYITGPTWAALLRDHPNGLPLERVLVWFSHLAEAVDFLHQHGIIHRDLKPSNIFLADCHPQGWVKVGDYGLSKLVGGQANDTHTQVGTVYYMAPEMSQGKYGSAVDIYAAGMVLYQMLTGRVPFDGQSVQEILLRHLTDEPDWSPLPSAVVPVLRQALAKDPLTRFTSLGEMAQQLQRVVHNSSVAQSVPASPRPRQPNQAGRWRSGTRPLEPSTVVYRPTNRWYEWARSALWALAGGLALTVFLMVIAWNLRPDIPWVQFAWLGSFGVTASWLLLAIQRLWWDYHWPDIWTRCLVRIISGMILGVLGAWLDGAAVFYQALSMPEPWMTRQAQEMTFAHQGLRHAAYFGWLFLLVPWEHLMRRDRQWSFSWNPVILTTLLAGALVWFWQQWEAVRWAEEWPKVLAVSLMATLVQWASPYDPPTSH